MSKLVYVVSKYDKDALLYTPSFISLKFTKALEKFNDISEDIRYLSDDVQIHCDTEKCLEVLVNGILHGVKIEAFALDKDLI